MGITAVFGFYDCQRWDYIIKKWGCKYYFPEFIQIVTVSRCHKTAPFYDSTRLTE